MAATSFQRLQRVLDLEKRQSWRNRAVIGGLPAMGERWAADARTETRDEAVINAVLALMSIYSDGDQTTRPGIAAAMSSALEGDLEPAGALLPATNASPTADEAPSADEAPAAVESTPAIPDPAPVARTPPREIIPPPEPTHVARRKAEARKAVIRNPADLQASPSILNGVGPARVEHLARLGIHQVIDLLWHLPFRYEDYSQLRTIDQIKPNEQVTLVANLWEVRTRKIGINREMVQAILADGTGTIHATWWNKWIVKKLEIGKTLRFSGKVSLYLGQKTLDNPVFEDVDEEMVSTGRLTPVYRLTEGVSNPWLRGLIKQVLDAYGAVLSDPLPADVRARYDLPDLQDALYQAHLPDDHAALDAARRRLAFEELFYIQLGVLDRRRNLKGATAPAMTVEDGLLDGYKAALPFPLTGAQARVLDENVRDLQRGAPMIRLVQGDVGSGKTAVAAGAMYVATANGMQSAMLAPTQVLAEQHHRGLGELLAPLSRSDGAPINIALLTGRVTGGERVAVLDGLRDGTVDIVVGTTALIQESVEFDNLGFVVVDEQHRFGVEQRGALRSKSELQPHLLVMSATPIPRSLALTVYGDLDVSAIDEMPPGRIPVKTKQFDPGERERLYSFMRREAQRGRQAFIIYPLVEESENLEAGAAIEGHKRLSEEIFPDLRVALLHGRMSGGDKDEVMRAFAAGKFDILVSTTVVEVGIDVPNASLIMIEDADRFGLAQLHQLRGRVGRGQHKSYCALISKAEGEDSVARLTALASTNDGFELAEKDLELRGPGDFLGTRQSGLPEMRIAQLSDIETLRLAREAAEQLFVDDPELTKHPKLQRQVERFWRGHGDVS